MEFNSVKIIQKLSQDNYYLEIDGKRYGYFYRQWTNETLLYLQEKEKDWILNIAGNFKLDEENPRKTIDKLMKLMVLK